MPRILVVEDDENSLWGLVHLLEAEGHHVVGVKNGQKACERLYEETFDYLLTDLTMPGITGLELHQKAMTFQPRIKTIIISAFSSSEILVKALEEGVYRYLVKPIDPDELCEIIESDFTKHDHEIISSLQWQGALA